MNLKNDLLQYSPQEFIEHLNNEQISRFYFVYDAQHRRVKCSHPQLQPIAEFLQADTRDFMEHEGLFFQITQYHDIIQGAFVHKTNRGQATGGVRYWHYSTVEDYLRDGLRLAKGMTRKNALAGLWWGGGKGVMAKNPAIDHEDPDIRAYIYREYGKFISSLRGCYVTAEDVGTHVSDMAKVFSCTRYAVCIPEEWGGSGNPSVPTARGVICGMEAALEFLGEGELAGKTVAIQGMGNVGGPLIRFLFEKDVGKVVACDMDARLVEKAKTELPDRNLEASVVFQGDESIFATECDILSPNATGAILNPRTISLIKASIICGAANNQLEDSQRDDELLFKRKLIYVPDFLTNRMGIVNAANEQYGYLEDDPLFERHLSWDWEYSIFQTCLSMFHESQAKDKPTARIAMEMADKLSSERHPIFGHRGQQIIDSLVATDWHKQ